MPRTRLLQNNFTAGEFTPRLHVRQDFPKYNNALAILQNFIIFPHGGVTRRNGTRFVKEVKGSASAVRLLPFEFNVEQAYVLEFGDLYIRFFTLSGRLEAPLGTPVEIASPFFADGLHRIQHAQSADILYLVNGLTRPRKLQRLTATAFSIVPIEFKDGPYLDQNTEQHIKLHVTGTKGIITITAVGQELFLPTHAGTPWRLNLGYGWGWVKMLQYVSSTEMIGEVQESLGDHFEIPANFVNQPLRDTAGSDMIAQGVRFDSDLVIGQVELLLQSFDAPAGEIWLEIRQADLNTNEPLADAIDVSVRKQLTEIPNSPTWVEFSFDESPTSPILNRGQQYYLVLRSSQGYSATNFVIWRMSEGDIYVGGKGYLQDFHTKVWFDLDRDFAIRILSTNDWHAPAWADHLGWPSAVTFFEQRLYFARDTTFYGSVINDFETFAPSFGSDPPADNNAVSFTIASTTVNRIQWMSGIDDLFIGTAGAEYRVVGANEAGITPNNPPLVREVSSYGSALLQPVKVGKNLVYLGRSRTKIREVVFNLSEDSFTSVDLILLSEHIGKRQFKAMTYQQDPDPMIIGILETGDIAQAVYLRSQDVVGWSVMPTVGMFESVTSIPHPAGDSSQVWVVVNRNGRRFVEYFEDRGGQHGPLYVDSGLSYSGPPTSTLTGLEHLNGMEVAIVGDGAIYDNQIVANGQVTGLYPPVSSADVGLPYTSILKELRPALSTQQGTLHGMPLGQASTTITFLESLGIIVNGDPIPYRFPIDPMDSGPPVFVGDKDFIVQGWDRDAQVTIEQRQPLPCTILAITRTIETGEP